MFWVDKWVDEGGWMVWKERRRKEGGIVYATERERLEGKHPNEVWVSFVRSAFASSSLPSSIRES